MFVAEFEILQPTTNAGSGTKKIPAKSLEEHVAHD
jgi:hypothetical protein